MGRRRGGKGRGDAPSTGDRPRRHGDAAAVRVAAAHVAADARETGGGGRGRGLRDNAGGARVGDAAAAQYHQAAGGDAHLRARE